MKKLFLVFALGLGLTVFAQEGKKQNNGKAKMEQMKKMTPEQRQKAHMDKLTKDLNLDATQQTQVSKIMADRNAKLRDMKAQMDALKKQMVDVNKDTKDKMKGALKPEQYTKWLEMREETKDKMVKHMEQETK